MKPCNGQNVERQRSGGDRNEDNKFRTRCARIEKIDGKFEEQRPSGDIGRKQGLLLRVAEYRPVCRVEGWKEHKIIFQIRQETAERISDRACRELQRQSEESYHNAGEIKRIKPYQPTNHEFARRQTADEAASISFGKDITAEAEEEIDGETGVGDDRLCGKGAKMTKDDGDRRDPAQAVKQQQAFMSWRESSCDFIHDAT